MSVKGITTQTQYLTFQLDKESYAFDITKVQSVLDFEKLTKVPRTPEFMRGVINLRGSVVPIVDLRLKFGMSRTKKTIDSCIIIAEINIDDELTVLGALADSVKEVIDLETEQIEPPPKIGTRLKTEFIKGMGKRNDEFIIIIDLDKIFTMEELNIVQEAGMVNLENDDEPAEKEEKKVLKGKKEEIVEA